MRVRVLAEAHGRDIAANGSVDRRVHVHVRAPDVPACILECARMSTGMWVDGSQQVGAALGRVMARLGFPSSLCCVGRTLRRPSSERERLFGVRPAPVVSFGSYMAGSTAVNLAQTSALSLTISGVAFMSETRTPTSAAEMSPVCSSTSWTSSTAVTCSPGTYGGGLIRLAVTVTGLVGTGAAFTFDSPVVSFSSLYYGYSNGAQSIGSLPLTVSGLGFGGASERTPTVSLASVTRMCDTVSWTTATAVTCDQPDYMAATWIDRLSTTVSGLVGTRTLLFTFDGARAFVSLRESIACRP